MNNEFEIIKEKADNGDASAELKLGEFYEEGEIVKQDYNKAFEYYLKASNQGIDEATNYVGLCYQDGLGVQKDFEQAAKYFEIASNNGYKYASSNLGFLYLNGLGVERNFNEAYKKISETSNSNRYLLDILEKINNGSKVIEADNISEIYNYDLKEFNDDDIIILKTENKINYNGYYDFKTIKKILNVIDELISDVEIDDTEFDRFMKVYINLANYLSYDKKAYNPSDNNEYVMEKATTSRNMIGLLTQNCICTGYSNILFNVLSCVRIDSKILNSNDHTFNKVKIDGKWYYCDLTLDSKTIKDSKLNYCLLSKSDFEDEPSHIAFDNTNDSYEDSLESYLRDAVMLKLNTKIR